MQRHHQVRAWLAGARLRSDARRVHIDGQVWHWKAGRSGIKLWDPAGQSRFVRWSTFLGLPIHEVERLQRKRSLAVTPADVAAYVKRGLGTDPLQALAAAARGAPRR